MGSEKIADVCIVGAGIIGCAIARRLSQSGRRILVIDSHPKQGMGTTSRNSEVIHAGIYYPKDFLKTKLCIEGRRALYDYSVKRGVSCRKIGKLIVATTTGEIENLEKIFSHAREVGVEGLSLLTAAQVAEMEPEVKAVSGIFSAESGIVSAHELCDAYLVDAEKSGTHFSFKTKIKELNFAGDSWELCTSEVDTPGKLRAESFSFKTDYVVNCAGLYADDVAAMAGIDINHAGYLQHWVKGNYFALAPHWRSKLRHLVYPIPEKNIRGLGTHVTIDLAGQVRLGPDVEEVGRVENYTVDPARGEKLYSSARTYLPSLRQEDIVEMMAGIRPKLTRPGEAQRDFVIAEESSRGLPGLVNLLGFESPGLTSSLAVAEHVAKLIGF